jgi:predicted enzyme related to lactoylglutathione lyase
VRDMEKARAFYGDVVGLTPGELNNDDFVEFDLGNATFALDSSGDALGISAGTSSGAAFEVEDVDGARQRLIDNGAVVTEVYEFPTCRICFAQDPEGNRFALHKRKSAV